MIEATFFYRFGFCRGFSAKGHANFSEAGKDIVCAGVSCAVQMCINAITEIIKADAKIFVDDGMISIKTDCKWNCVQFFFEALKLQLEILQNKYKENIKLNILEED